MDDKINQVLSGLTNPAIYKFFELKRILGLDDITLLQKILQRYFNCLSTKTEVALLEGTILSVPSHFNTIWKTSTSKKD